MMGAAVWVVPILHPAYILRGLFGLEPAQVLYLKRVRKILDGWEPPQPSVEEGPPGALTHPTLEQMFQWKGELERLPDRTLAVDIENAGDFLLCVGFCRVADEQSLCVPLRKQGGEPWWEWEDLREVVGWLCAILEDPSIPKVFHNGQAHDVPVLERLGFEVRGYAGDTLIMQHVAYPEMPKRLEFIGILYSGMPAWKWLSRGADEEGEGK